MGKLTETIVESWADSSSHWTLAASKQRVEWSAVALPHHVDLLRKCRLAVRVVCADNVWPARQSHTSVSVSVSDGSDVLLRSPRYLTYFAVHHCAAKCYLCTFFLSWFGFFSCSSPRYWLCRQAHPSNRSRVRRRCHIPCCSVRLRFNPLPPSGTCAVTTSYAVNAWVSLQGTLTDVKSLLNVDCLFLIISYPKDSTLALCCCN